MSRIPLCIPNVGDLEARNLQSCIDTNFVSYAGAFVSEFEQMLSEETGASHVAALSAGTTSLHAGLVALGVQTDDLVIVPTLTFIASPNSVSHCGAQPWLIDCDVENWLLDPAFLSETLSKECQRDKSGHVIHKPTGKIVRAIMPVYMLGVPVDIDGICDVSEEWGLPVLVDAAAALGAQYNGNKIGECRAQLLALSFNANKIITTGGGGALISNDGALINHIKHMTTTARTRPGYDHDMVGYNYRMTNVQAALGVGQMHRFSDFKNAKVKIAQKYHEQLSIIDGCESFPAPQWASANHWLSGIYLKDWDDEKIEALRFKLQDNHIEVPPFWKPIHLQKPYLKAPRHLTGAAEKVWSKIMPLPCSTNLTDSEQNRVIDIILEFSANT